MRYLATVVMAGFLLFMFRFLLHTELPLYGVIQKYDVLLALTWLTVFWALGDTIAAWIWETKKENRLCHVLLVVACAFVLIFPITKISSEQVSKAENRNLAKFPSLTGEGGFHYEYGKQFEAWLNDHFRGRDKALRIYGRVESFLNGKRETEQAMEGREGWLFYKGDHSVENFQNRRNFTEKELREIKEKLEQKKEYCASFGARYYVLIAPDKNKVYGEFYPSHYFKINPIGRGEQLYRYLKENSDVKVVYPLSALLEAKKENQLYYKNDTHWNQAGAFIGYREIMKVIARDDEALPIFSFEDFDRELVKKQHGDLQGMLGIRDWQEEDPVLRFKTGAFYRTKQPDIETTKFVASVGRPYLITVRDEAPYHVFVFRDSFTENLLPFFSQQFGHVEYLWTRDFFRNAAAVREKKPDIVIEEVVERYVQDLVN